jgi:serine phosphatase RsbU (regulator of sigma subunit)
MKTGLYLQRYAAGRRDSLLLMDAQTFNANLSNWQWSPARRYGNSIILGLDNSDILYQINLDKRLVKPLPVPEGTRVQSLHSLKTDDAVLVSFRDGHELLLRLYKDKPDGSLDYREWRFMANRLVEEYKTVILSISSNSFYIVFNDGWTNRTEDHLFLKIVDEEVLSIEYPDLFANPRLSEDVSFQLKDNSFAVYKHDHDAKLVDVTMINLNSGQNNNFSIPAAKGSYVMFIFSNDHYAFYRSDDRLWRFDHENKSAIEHDIQRLSSKYGPSSYLANEEPLVVWIDGSKDGGAILTEAEEGSLKLMHSYEESARRLGYSKTQHRYYYWTQAASSKQVYSVDLKSGKRSLVFNTNEKSKLGMRDNYLFDLSTEKLLRYQGDKIELSAQKPAIIDSLRAWTMGDKEYFDKLFEDFSFTVLSNGHMWHSGQSYQLSNDLDIDIALGLNQKHVSSAKLRIDGERTFLELPDFMYDPAKDTITMFPKVIRMWEIDSVPWLLYYEGNFPGPLKLGRLQNSEIVPIEVQPSINMDENDVGRVYLYEDSEYPMVFIKDTLYYRYQNAWQEKIFPKGQIGWYPIVKRHQADIWISSTGGLLKFSPNTGMVNKLDLGIGLIDYNANIWFKDEHLYIKAENRIYKVNIASTAAKVMIPWFSSGKHRHLLSSNPRLKYYQNNIRIPIEIFNEAYPEKCQIKYRLHGYDEDYQIRPYSSDLEYRKLKPGRYSIEVVAVTPEGLPTEPLLFSFRVQPPLWANYYAYVLYLLLFLALLYAIHKKRTQALLRQKVILEDKVKERTAELVEEKQKMTESLEYASLIQSSILPLDSEFRELIPDYFVIYRPRDIVSGDFYWLHRDVDCFYLALIDCTGHGVPGALIAVTVNSILNYLVKERKLKEPREILSMAHREIGKFLHQQSSLNQQDGFEIALMQVFPASRKICYAGAKRPPYVYSEGKMLKIPATRNAIGGLKWHQELEFSSTSFSYQSKTKLYLFTDGIVDQPHPAYGRKLGSARWLELLSENATMPIAEQEQSINNLLQQMLEYSDQRDDITIIGLELP